MAGLESLVNMDILDLHGNQISVMTNLNRLASLRVLNLAANALKKVPSLEGLSSLQELNVKRNRISKIASQTGHARKLERLYLSNNELRGWVFVPRRSSTGHFHCLVFQQALDSFYLCSLLSIPLVTWFFFLFFFSFFFFFFLLLSLGLAYSEWQSIFSSNPALNNACNDYKQWINRHFQWLNHSFFHLRLRLWWLYLLQAINLLHWLG